MSINRPTALLIGAGDSQRALATILNSRGFRLVTLAKDLPQFPTDGHIQISTFDTDEALAAAVNIHSRTPFSIVVSRTSGPAAQTLGAIAHRLELPGPGLELSAAAEKKMALYEWCTKRGVPTVDSRSVSGSIWNEREFAYPSVVKPNIGPVGKQGVTVVRSPQLMRRAVSAAQLASWDHTAVIQPYVDGSDFNLHLLAIEGSICWRVVTQEVNTFGERGGIAHAAQALVDVGTQQSVLKLVLGFASSLVRSSGLTGHAVFSFKISFREPIAESLALCYETNVGPPGDGVTELLRSFFSHDAFEAEVDALFQAKRVCPRFG